MNQTNWKIAFWGSHYDNLSAIKTKYDPIGLFWVSPGCEQLTSFTFKMARYVADRPRALPEPPLLAITETSLLG